MIQQELLKSQWSELLGPVRVYLNRGSNVVHLCYGGRDRHLWRTYCGLGWSGRLMHWDSPSEVTCKRCRLIVKQRAHIYDSCSVDIDTVAVWRDEAIENGEEQRAHDLLVYLAMFG